MPKALVIVESPAKSKTINKILGSDYQVVSSMGHIIDLPKNKMGIQVDKDFEAEYIVIPERRKFLAKIKKDAKKVEEIYLAADPDREGEAISWHLGNELGKNKKVFRVTFDEITEKAVKNAFLHPREIYMNLVKAQQARRILDRLVGYSISPILWVKVTKGLSAGRVQSVAVRLIVDREKEIRAFKPLEYWDIEAELKKKAQAEGSFIAKLDKYDGKNIELTNKLKTDEIIAQLEKGEYQVSDIKESTKKKSPLPPFTTSKLQQEAFNKLRYPVNRTMKIAQALYEGLELGEEGSVGLITYMRTDSVRISQDAQKEAKKYIIEKYGEKYYPETPNAYKAKKSAQEAHEAIRPTLPLREPKSLEPYLKPEQMKLYELIWNRFVSSQMKPAQYAVTSVSITTGKYLFKATGTNMIFDGFMALYKVEDEEDDQEKTVNIIPNLVKGELVDLIKLIPAQHFTKPPARYSDASLVKALEEKGIGRPSTYAPTILTIISRNYVKRMSGYLHPTELGETVTDLLVKHFPTILDIKFTADMENELDGIESGETDWLVVMKSFYSPFMHTVEQAKTEMKSIRKEGIKTDEICPQCGKGLIIKWGRKGRFLSCSAFPACKFAKSITTGVKCPQEGCDGELVERRSKRGAFYGCSKYPKCTYTSRRLPKDTKQGEE